MFTVRLRFHKREAATQSVVILWQTPVADVGEARESFRHGERTLYFHQHTQLAAALRTLKLVYAVLLSSSPQVIAWAVGAAS